MTGALRWRALATSILGATAAAWSLFAPAAVAQPTDLGDGCVIDPDDRAVTIESLRFHCTVAQQDQLYLDAEAGPVPTGTADGWVTRPPRVAAAAPDYWIGKTFATGPDGGTAQNRVTASGVELLQTDVYRAPSMIDGEPSWVLNGRPGGVPQLIDEIRRVTPDVWFGYSYWVDGVDKYPYMIAAFVLTPAER